MARNLRKPKSGLNGRKIPLLTPSPFPFRAQLASLLQGHQALIALMMQLSLRQQFEHVSIPGFCQGRDGVWKEDKERKRKRKKKHTFAKNGSNAPSPQKVPSSAPIDPQLSSVSPSPTIPVQPTEQIPSPSVLEPAPTSSKITILTDAGALKDVWVFPTPPSLSPKSLFEFNGRRMAELNALAAKPPTPSTDEDGESCSFICDVTKKDFGYSTWSDRRKARWDKLNSSSPAWQSFHDSASKKRPRPAEEPEPSPLASSLSERQLLNTNTIVSLLSNYTYPPTGWPPT